MYTDIDVYRYRCIVYSVPASAEAEAGLAAEADAPVPKLLPYSPPSAGRVRSVSSICLQIYMYTYSVPASVEAEEAAAVAVAVVPAPRPLPYSPPSAGRVRSVSRRHRMYGLRRVAHCIIA